MKTNTFPSPTPNLSNAILGIWKLESRTDVDESGNRNIDPILGPNPLGSLCFAPGHFAAQFMKRDRSNQESSAEPNPGKNNSVSVDGYDAYFGTYSLDEDIGTLTVHLEGSISPSNIGGIFVRDIRVLNDELIIRLPTTAADGTPITRILAFSRLG